MEDLEKKLLMIKKVMEECNHLFIKTKEGEWTGGFHSSDYEYTPCTVSCVKCGLTNYHLNMGLISRYNFNEYIKKVSAYKYGLLTINDEVFKKQYGNQLGYRRDKTDEMIFNLMSNEVCNIPNPCYWYRMAVNAIPNGSKTEIFNKMIELYNKSLEINNNISNPPKIKTR